MIFSSSLSADECTHSGEVFAIYTFLAEKLGHVMLLDAFYLHIKFLAE